MLRSSTTLRRALVRALVVPVAVLLAVTGYLVGASALATNTSSDTATTSPPDASAWRSGYSRRFPGCVASVLWPERETPVAIVTRSRSGEVARVVTRQASQRLFTRVRSGDVRIIGACYRR